MENAYILDAKFIDRKTIHLSEEYPFKEKEVRLIILPEKTVKKSRASERKNQNG